jgi:hypothetical protein
MESGEWNTLAKGVCGDGVTRRDWSRPLQRGGDDPMRKAAVRNGDPTTTGGRVIACESTIYDKNKERVALDGEKATCGNCKGAYRTVGTGKGIINRARSVVVDGDRVLCPCGKNRVMVGSNAGIFLETKVETEHTDSAIISAAAPSIIAGIAAIGDDEGDGKEYPAASANDEGRPDCSYLDGSRGRIDAPANLYGHTNSVTVSSGKQTTFDFPGGGSGAATRYDATVSGHPVSIFVSTRPPAAGYGVPDGKQIARALETVPREQYKNLEKISVSAEPQDAVWQRIYGNPSFSSAATANISQGVAFYPWKGFSTIPQQYVDSTMLHETGHLWSESLWRDPARKQAWLDAVTDDAHAPSQYALNNMTEDFAESANMYWSSKGTPCEVEGRKRYPSRYAYFDKISN